MVDSEDGGSSNGSPSLSRAVGFPPVTGRSCHPGPNLATHVAPSPNARRTRLGPEVTAFQNIEPHYPAPIVGYRYSPRDSVQLERSSQRVRNLCSRHVNYLILRWTKWGSPLGNLDESGTRCYERNINISTHFNPRIRGETAKFRANLRPKLTDHGSLPGEKSIP